MGPRGVLVCDPGRDSDRECGRGLGITSRSITRPARCRRVFRQSCSTSDFRARYSATRLCTGCTASASHFKSVRCHYRIRSTGACRRVRSARSVPALLEARDRPIGGRFEALARYVFNYLPHPRAQPTGELLTHEVELSMSFDLRLDQDRGSCPDGLADRYAAGNAPSCGPPGQFCTPAAPTARDEPSDARLPSASGRASPSIWKGSRIVAMSST